MIKSICVFCGSSHGASPSYALAARRLGALLAQNKITLVYGGGNIGLMGELADAAMAASGQVIGIIPQALVDRELAHHGVTELKIVTSMHERKQLMSDLADAYIALPGGLGTLEEFFEVLTWAQLGIHSKPAGILNIAGYYDHLRVLLGHMRDENFIRPEHLDMIVIDELETRLLERLQSSSPVQFPKWIDESKI
jgi:uncharacterized protein (TIGR00730 family)